MKGVRRRSGQRRSAGGGGGGGGGGRGEGRGEEEEAEEDAFNGIPDGVTIIYHKTVPVTALLLRSSRSQKSVL